MELYERERRKNKIKPRETFKCALESKTTLGNGCVFILENDRQALKYKGKDDIMITSFITYEEHGKLFSYLCEVLAEPMYIDETVLRLYNERFEVRLSATYQMLVHLFKENEFVLGGTCMVKGDELTLFISPAGILIGRKQGSGHIISCKEFICPPKKGLSDVDRQLLIWEEFEAIIRNAGVEGAEETYSFQR